MGFADRSLGHHSNYHHNTLLVAGITFVWCPFFNLNKKEFCQFRVNFRDYLCVNFFCKWLKINDNGLSKSSHKVDTKNPWNQYLCGLSGILESGFDSRLLHARVSAFTHISENRVYFRDYHCDIIELI